MRLEGKKYQPSPKNIKTGTAEDPLLRIVELLGNSEGNSISSSATQCSTLIRFRRIGSKSKSGKRNTYIVSLFVDSSPLKPSDSLEAALKIAATKNSKIFIKKNNHDMVLELKDNEDSDTIAVFDGSDYKTSLGTILGTSSSDIVLFDVCQRAIEIDSENEDCEKVTF